MTTKPFDRPLIVFGYPKSGNTWIGGLLSYYYNAPYLDAHLEEGEAGDQNVTSRGRGIPYAWDGFTGTHHRPDQPPGPWTCVIKSHHHPRDFPKFLPRVLSNCELRERPILIIREPKDVAVSYYFYHYFHLPTTRDNFPAFPLLYAKLLARQVLSFQKFVKQVAEEWRDFHRQWLDTPHYPIKYEDLLLDPYGTMSEFLRKNDGYVMEKYLREAVEYCRFINLRKLEEERFRFRLNEERFFRQGKSNDWPKYFSRGLERQFQEIIGDVYGRMGYGEASPETGKDVVISIENLSKEYRLGAIGTGTLFRDLQSWWARCRGLPDPNSSVEADWARGTSGASSPRTNGQFLALKNISFQVKKGSILGIIGRNGAGKSTLLKILSRVTAPSAGRTRVKGRIASLLEVGTGFHPELSGRENIYLNGAILGMTKGEISSKLQAIIDFAEVSTFIDTPVKRYSSGMYVRLAFAVAAHLEPEILIIDEVLAVGDAQFQNKCLGKMDDVSSKEGRTVLFVSHNMGLISSICHRVILLDGGRVQADGKPSDVILQYYSSGTSSPAQADFVGQGLKIGDAYAQLLSACVRDSQGVVCNNFLLEQEITVEMTLRILQYQAFAKYMPYPCLFVYGTDGDCIFYSTSPNQSNRALSPGVYQVSCRIPSYFLNTGTYFLGLAFSNCDKGPPQIHFFEKNALCFQIREDLSVTMESRNGFAGTVPGMLRPQLDWRMTECLDPTSLKK